MTIQERQTLDRIEALELRLKLAEGTIQLMRKWQSAHMEHHEAKEQYDNWLRSAAGDKFDKQFGRPMQQLDSLTDSLRPQR